MNIGYVAGESTPSSVEVITSSALAVGKYIMIGSSMDGILGLVEHSKVSSSAMDIAKDYRSAQEATQVSSIDLRDKRYTSKIMLLGALNTLQKEKPRLPDVPPEPGTPIYEGGEMGKGRHITSRLTNCVSQSSIILDVYLLSRKSMLETCVAS